MWQCSKKVVRCFIEDVLRRAVPPQHLFLQTGGGVASLPLERATPGVGKADLRFVLHTVCDSLYHNGGWGQRKRRYVYLGLKIMPLLCYNLWFFPYLFLFFFSNVRTARSRARAVSFKTGGPQKSCLKRWEYHNL